MIFLAHGRSCSHRVGLGVRHELAPGHSPPTAARATDRKKILPSPGLRPHKEDAEEDEGRNQISKASKEKNSQRLTAK